MLFVAFLRGINVGGNASVSMATLKACFEKQGYKQVTTYINSGNVIFEATGTARALEEKIEQALHKTFSFPIRTIVRDFDEMTTLVHHIPKHWDNQSDWRHNVIFLSHRIDSKHNFSGFIPKPQIEEMHYFPGVVLWSAKTSDLTKSTMLTINKSALYKEMTVRNLNTTRKVYQIMQNLHQ